MKPINFVNYRYLRKHGVSITKAAYLCIWSTLKTWCFKTFHPKRWKFLNDTLALGIHEIESRTKNNSSNE